MGFFTLPKEPRRGNNHKLRTGKATAVQHCHKRALCVLDPPGRALGEEGCQSAGQKGGHTDGYHGHPRLVDLTSTWVYLKTSLTSLRMCTW